MQRLTALDSHTVASCTAALQQGGVIVYPTDTVYGLGANATNKDAVLKIRAIKGRTDTKPILAIVEDLDMLAQYAIITPLARVLATAFLPGPLTLILNTHSTSLSAIAHSDGSVGFRIPDSFFCRNLLHAFGRPITSTSVNRSGMEQPDTLADMLAQLNTPNTRIATVVDAGTLPSSPPSTIVDVREGHTCKVMREGAIPASIIESVIASHMP